MRIRHPHHRLRKRSGFTLIEIAVAMPIIALALGMMVQMMTAGTGLRQVSRDNWRSASAAQDTLEIMRNQEFGQLVALYNQDPLDDPGGPGTAPGIHFSVDGLPALASDPDGFAGRVILPLFNAGTEVAPDWQLREDQANETLGMPRDLNGDSILADADCSGDYVLLPVQIEIQWRGRFGPRLVRFQTIFSELR